MKAGLDELTVEFEQDGVEIRSAEWGDMHLAQYTLAPGTDLSPFFEGLPENLCSGNHYGTVLEGEIVLRYADTSEEITRAGEFFHWAAGHTAWTDVGVTFLAVTPLTEVREMEARLGAAPAD